MVLHQTGLCQFRCQVVDESLEPVVTRVVHDPFEPDYSSVKRLSHGLALQEILSFLRDDQNSVDKL